MEGLFLHPDAERDLLSIRKESPTVFKQFVLLLEQLHGDSDLLDRLTQHGFGQQGIDEFSIQRWAEQWRKGHNLWRLRLWSIGNYRLIYAFLPQEHEYHVLGIVPREFNYASDHILTQRIKRAYQNLLDEG